MHQYFNLNIAIKVVLVSNVDNKESVTNRISLLILNTQLRYYSNYWDVTTSKS